MAYSVTAKSLYLDVVHGSFFSRAVFTVCELQLADHLQGTMTVLDLANAARTDAPSTERLMKFLSVYGLFQAVDTNSYCHNEASELLRADNPHSVRHSFLLHSRVISKAMTTWPTAIRDGHSIPFQSAFDTSQSYWDFLCSADNLELKSSFDKAMTVNTERVIGSIVKEFPWQQYAGAKIVDVGGGLGHLLAALCREVESFTGEVFDLPETVVQAKHFWEENCAEVIDRVTFSGGSFFTEIPRHGDLFLLKNILHDWSDSDCLRILTHLASAMRLSAFPARALLLEQVYDLPPRDASVADHDLIMFTLFRGKERATEEFRALLEQADLQLLSTTHLSSISVLSVQLKP